MPNCPYEARDRSRDGGRCALRLCAGGCRLRAERAVPPGAYGPQSCLGGWHPSSPQGVSCRRAADLARCQARPPATAACPRYSIDTGRRHAGRCQVANCELANRDERQAQGSLCRCPRPHSRRTTAANQGQGSATSAGDEAWLIGEHRASGEKKYYLANLPAATSLRTLAATIKARWICEQAHQQLKEELGLDHFEGRSWQGLHRHALMTMLAFAFLQHRRLKKVRRGKKNQRTTASTELASRASRHRRAPRSTATSTLPALPKMDVSKKAA